MNIIRFSFEKTLSDLKQQYGPDLDAWQYGKNHVSDIPHLLDVPVLNCVGIPIPEMATVQTDKATAVHRMVVHRGAWLWISPTLRIPLAFIPADKAARLSAPITITSSRCGHRENISHCSSPPHLIKWMQKTSQAL